MRQISFALTTPQFRDGSKTVTRRLGWSGLKAGDVLCAIEKGQGLKKGEKVKKLGIIEIISACRESLRRMIDEPDYGARECVLEGYPPPHPKSDPAEFVKFFCATHKDCRPETVITRIHYTREISAAAQCERYGGGGAVRRAFVILKSPGTIPEGKGAFLTNEHLQAFVREAIACRSADTQITVCELTWNDELWVQCGREMVAVDRALDEAAE